MKNIKGTFSKMSKRAKVFAIIGLIAVTILSMVGCSKEEQQDVEELNRTIEELNRTIDELKTSNDEKDKEIAKLKEDLDEVDQIMNKNEELQKEISMLSNNTTIPESPMQSYDGIAIGDKVKTWGNCDQTAEKYIDYYKLPKVKWYDYIYGESRWSDGDPSGARTDNQYLYEVVFIAPFPDTDRVMYVLQGRPEQGSNHDKEDDRLFVIHREGIEDVYK